MRALPGLMAMQTLMTMAIYSLPVIVPVAAVDLGISPESVGFYVALIYGTAMLAGLLTGDLLGRFGATVLFQLMLATIAAAELLLLNGGPTTLFIAVLMIGLASGPMNPTGSHVLARIASARQRALVFSIKQCATPAGGMLAGLLLPPLMLLAGWKTAVLLLPVLALLLILVAPAARLGGRENPDLARSFSLARTTASLAGVLRERQFRSLTLIAFCLAMAQMAMTTYLVVYLWREVGFSETAAGLVFAVFHLSGIGSRIVLGAIADRLLAANWILAALCLLLALALFAMAQFNSHWPLLPIYAVVAIAGGSGNGWVGLYFSELARLAPAEQVASVTGASQFFTYAGLLAGPVLFGLLLHSTDSYRFCLLCFAVVTLAAAGYLTLLNTDKK